MPALRPVLVAALLATCTAGRAMADVPVSTASPDEARRTALYREGVDLANAGRWDEAVKRFREVVAIRSAPPALFTLAEAEEHLGELATAEHTYERALTEAQAAGATDVAGAARDALSSIEPRVPRLVIVLAQPVDNATATVDGAPAPMGEAVKVNPGERHVVVVAPGRHAFQSSISLTAGQSLSVTAHLRSDDAPSRPPPDSGPPAAVPSAFPTLPLILGGGGLVVGVVGIGLGLAGQSRYSDANSNCTGGVCSRQSDVDNGNAGRTEVMVGTVLAGVGAAAVAGAVVWWLAGRSSSPTSSTGVRVTVSPLRDGAGASVFGSF
jgi:hypothetical protein